MTELRQRMIDAMVQRGFALRTQETYVGAIRRMAKHYRRDPATYTVQEVQAYLLHMVKDEKLSYSSMNQAACATQFLVRGAARALVRAALAPAHVPRWQEAHRRRPTARRSQKVAAAATRAAII